MEKYDRIGYLVDDLRDLRTNEWKVDEVELEIATTLLKLKYIVMSKQLQLSSDMLEVIIKEVVDTMIIYEKNEYAFAEISNFGYDCLINISGSWNVDLDLVKYFTFSHSPLVFQQLWALANIWCQGFEYQLEVLRYWDLPNILLSLISEMCSWSWKLEKTYYEKVKAVTSRAKQWECRENDKYVSTAIAYYVWVMYLMWNNSKQFNEHEDKNLFSELIRSQINNLKNCTKFCNSDDKNLLISCDCALFAIYELLDSTDSKHEFYNLIVDEDFYLNLSVILKNEKSTTVCQVLKILTLIGVKMSLLPLLWQIALSSSQDIQQEMVNVVFSIVDEQSDEDIDLLFTSELANVIIQYLESSNIELKKNILHVLKRVCDRSKAECLYQKYIPIILKFLEPNDPLVSIYISN